MITYLVSEEEFIKMLDTHRELMGCLDTEYQTPIAEIKSWLETLDLTEEK
jgi:signal transduction histidine kinase